MYKFASLVVGLLLVLVVWPPGKTFASILYSAGSVKTSDDVSIEGELVDVSSYMLSEAKLVKSKESLKEKAASGVPVGIVDAHKNLYIIIAPAPRYAAFMTKVVKLTGLVKNGTICPKKMEIKSDTNWEEVQLENGAPHKLGLLEHIN